MTRLNAARLVFGAVVASLFWVAPLSAQPIDLIDPGLPGSTQYDGWEDITISNYPTYPGFPGSGVWTDPIGSNTGGSADANLNKVSGAAFPAGDGLYFGGFSSVVNNPTGAVMSVADTSPVSGLKNVVFQIQIGEAWTYDFYNDVLPTLSYNGGAQNLVPTGNFLLEAFFNGTVEMNGEDEDLFINTYLLQWDLSSAGAITDFTIRFNAVQHSQVYSMRLDQSSQYAAFQVPEPASLGLLAIGALCLPRRRVSRSK